MGSVLMLELIVLASAVTAIVTVTGVPKWPTTHNWVIGALATATFVAALFQAITDRLPLLALVLTASLVFVLNIPAGRFWGSR